MIKKILVPLDGSKLAETALPYARALAQKLEAELILVRVVQPTLQPVPAMVGYGEIVEYVPLVFHDSSEVNHARVYLKVIQDHLHFSVHAKVLEGYPEANVITDIAGRESVDLIVMSTHGRSGISRLVYGSVANTVLQSAPCPVLLVKATEPVH